uniref:Uncharacterized protein n=1 Tax=Rousettus aegyptiacus TaxID=9407 RepID=A0A7J8JGP3_ROUAE|nr:hypothetical protein HJG63_010193 [Rousettus aegyptiacus]
MPFLKKYFLARFCPSSCHISTAAAAATTKEKKSTAYILSTDSTRLTNLISRFGAIEGFRIGEQCARISFNASKVHNGGTSCLVVWRSTRFLAQRLHLMKCNLLEIMDIPKDRSWTIFSNSLQWVNYR